MESAEQQIQDTLQSAALIKELTDGYKDVRQHRQVFEMEGKSAESNFTITQLATDKCFAAPPLTLMSVDAQTAVTIHYLGVGMAGHPGIVHGGVISIIFDECAGQGAVTHFEALAKEQAQSGQTDGEFARQPRDGVLAVTAQMSIDYKSPARVEAVVVTRAVVDKENSSSRKAAIIIQMWQQAAGPNGDGKMVEIAAGKGLYIRPRAAV